MIQRDSHVSSSIVAAVFCSAGVAQAFRSEAVGPVIAPMVEASNRSRVSGLLLFVSSSLCVFNAAMTGHAVHTAGVAALWLCWFLHSERWRRAAGAEYRLRVLGVRP